MVYNSSFDKGVSIFSLSMTCGWNKLVHLSTISILQTLRDADNDKMINILCTILVSTKVFQFFSLQFTCEWNKLVCFP
jgi:hypothetical protein